MRVYQSIDGKWIYFDGKTKTYFDTESEAMIAMSKAKMVNEVLEVIKGLVMPMERAKDVWQLYWDLGGSVTADDLAASGLTTDEFAGMITTLEQFEKFCNNEAVTPAAYRININKAKVSGV
jgi:hypothetical protein